MTDKTPTSSKPSALNNPAGSFEGCFSKGLDLTEFCINNDRSNESTTPSHSSRLLQIRKNELVQKELEMKEDDRFRTLARNRSAQIKQELIEQSLQSNEKTLILKARHPNDGSVENNKNGQLEIVGESSLENNNDNGFLQALIIGGLHESQEDYSYGSRRRVDRNKNDVTNLRRLNNNYVQSKRLPNNSPRRDSKRIQVSKKSKKSKY